MSKVRAEQYTNRMGTGAPEIPYGVTVPEGASIDGAGGLNLTGIATAGSFKGNLTGDVSGNVTGVAATFTGPVTIGGTLTYEDVTNIDSVGIVTARSGIDITGASAGVNGSSNLILKTNSSERLRITSTGGVGIATAAPAGTLHVQGNQVGAIVAMAANSVNCSLGNYFTKTITGATTFTFDSVPSNVEYSFTLEVTLNGSNAITWPTSVKWNADTAPSLTDGKTQLFMFVTNNGGTRWRGSALVDYVN